MTSDRAGAALRHVRKLMGACIADSLTDAELVRRFAEAGEEDAFAALLQRHGPLVWGVCREALLADEVGRLPEKYRAPFVLCCLEGRSRDEAVRELGWPKGTVASRLAQARKLLQQRLVRRGVAPAVLVGAAAASPVPASAAL